MLPKLPASKSVDFGLGEVSLLMVYEELLDKVENLSGDGTQCC